jgi:hypothetical protein
MSLKAFHLVFVSAAGVIAVGCGIWALWTYSLPEGRTGDLIFGLGCFAAAAALVLYERYFLKKTRGITLL